MLQHFVDRTPGSFVEEKDYSLVWHYRMADPDSGEWLANELVARYREATPAAVCRLLGERVRAMPA